MDLHPSVMIANEEYFIYYILRDMAEFFPILVYDTGSTDNTCDIIRTCFPDVELVEVGPKDRNELGKLREEMFDKTGYPTMKLDGDEFYPYDTAKFFKEFEMPEGKTVGFTHTRTIGVRPNGTLYEREGKSTDCVFAERVTWFGNYPHEGHSLFHTFREGGHKSIYYDGHKYWGLHLHHLVRSSKDNETLWRAEKKEIYVPKADKGDIDLREIMNVQPGDPYNPYFK